MKRIISLLLAVLTLVSVIATTVSAEAPIDPETGMPFTDVKASHWFYDAVKYTYENGIFSANNAAGDKFAPNTTLTRAMFVTVLFRLSGADQSAYTGETVFTDVPVNQWYAKAVQWASEKGYVAGMTATTFVPNGKITRSQMARILSLYAAGEDNYDLTDVRSTALARFGDADKVRDWAVEGMTWMTTTKLISGMGTKNGTPILEPDGNATRAQAATLLKGYMELRYGKETPVGEVYIGENDLADYTIVYGDTAFKNVSESSTWHGDDCAEQLRKYIQKATGIDLPVKSHTEPRADESNDKEILIGQTNRENGIVTVDRSSFDGDSLLIEVQGNYLILASNEQYSGTAYAVLEFCEKFLGYTFFGAVETIVGKNVVEIPSDYSYTESTPMHYRMSYNKKFGQDVQLRNDENYYSFANIVHTIPEFAASPEEYRTDWSFHLQHYLSPDPCLTRPDHVQNIITNVMTYLDNKPYNNLIWVCQADGEIGCNGRTAADIAAGCTCAQEYRDHGKYSTYVTLLDKVAEALEEEAKTNPERAYFADYYVVGLAYKYTWVKLKNTDDWDIHDKVLMCICTDSACSAHALTDPDCKNVSNGNVSYQQVYETYAAVCDNLFVWDYINGDVYSDSPFPIIHQMYDNYKFFHKEGMWGAYVLGDSTTNASFPELKTYLISKLLWEDDMTEEEYWNYVDSFLEAFYGDGWSYIREYIEVTHELASKNEWHIWTKNRWDHIIKYDQYVENFDYLMGLWEKAEELAFTDEQKLNVRRSAVQMKYIEVCVAYQKYRLSEDEADLEAFKAVNTAYGDYLATLGHDSYSLPSNWTVDGDPNLWRNDAK